MKTALLLLAIIASSSLAPAQQPPLKALDPPDLVARKAEHIRDMFRAQIVPLTSYIQTLTFLRQQYVRESKSEAIGLVDAEIQSARQELDAATAGSNITTTAAAQLQIDEAIYGDLVRNRVDDVTHYIQNAFASGQPSVSIYRPTMLGAHDPAPGVHKSTRITYTINGKRKTKEFKDGPDSVVDFKKDLR